MKVTLDIPENKYQFFLELVKSLNFVKVDDSPYNPEFVAKVEQSKKEFKNGEFTRVKKNELQDLLGLE